MTGHFRINHPMVGPTVVRTMMRAVSTAFRTRAAQLRIMADNCDRIAAEYEHKGELTARALEDCESEIARVNAFMETGNDIGDQRECDGTTDRHQDPAP